MSGGELVVLERCGRDGKRYGLSSGLATLGSHPACDIRVLLPEVRAHHATVSVHAKQVVVCLLNENQKLGILTPFSLEVVKVTGTG